VRNVFCPLSTFDQTQATHHAILWRRTLAVPRLERPTNKSAIAFRGPRSTSKQGAEGRAEASQPDKEISVRWPRPILRWRARTVLELLVTTRQGHRQFRHTSVLRKKACIGCCDIHVYQSPDPANVPLCAMAMNRPKKVPRVTEHTSLRLEPELREALETAAEPERRPLAHMMRKFDC
jgi:hypothetical protein